MENLLKDIRYGVRGLWKRPGFTAIAVLTLALGIGANTAIFSVVNAVLLRPLQFRDPERLMMIWEDASFAGFPRNTPAPANYVVVLSHALWQTRYGGDPRIINRDVQLDGAKYTVVGVMPAGFQFMENDV